MAFHYDVRDRVFRGGDELDDVDAGRFEAFAAIPELAFGLPGDLAVQIRVPFHWKRFKEAASGTDVRKTGLGDVELLASRDVARSGAYGSRQWRVAVSAGVALPTGEHEAQPFVGQAAPTPLQLGGGTYDPILALTAGLGIWTGWEADASVAVRLAMMENADDYRPPSLLEIAGGAAWRSGNLRLALHAEWSHLTRVEVGGVEAPSTGRDAIYVVSGASLGLWPAVDLLLTARVPLALDVNETQLAESALLGARLSYRR